MILGSCAGPKSFVNKAEYEITEKKFDEAKTHLDSAFKYEENKNWAKAWYVKGNYHYNKYENAPEGEKDEDQLIEAYESYKKAFGMDDGDKYKDMLNFQLYRMSKMMINEGVEAFNEQEYNDAFVLFKYTIEIEMMPDYYEDKLDTAVVYNTALAAYNIKKYEEAINYFEQSAELGYGESKPFILMKDAYMKLGDTAQGVKVLKSGYKKYPSDISILNMLVDHYIKTDQPQEALDYLQKAKEQQPDNEVLYFAEGTLYERIGKTNKAIEAYKKSSEIKPDYFDALYNLGVLHYNKGVDMAKAANEIDNHAKYKKAKKEADEEFKKAIPYLEEALELKANDINTLNTLKTIYLRLEMNDKYKKIKKKLEILGEGEEE
jgi:tetratricopeptide (TPR) repeat protein